MKRTIIISSVVWEKLILMFLFCTLLGGDNFRWSAWKISLIWNSFANWSMGNKNRYKQEVEGSLYVFIEILHIYRNRFAILQTANNEIFKVVQAASSHELKDLNLNTSLVKYIIVSSLCSLENCLKKPLNRAKHYDAMPIQLFF